MSLAAGGDRRASGEEEGSRRSARRPRFSRGASLALVLLLESTVSGSLITSAGMATKGK
jgi:hypothetical protein